MSSSPLPPFDLSALPVAHRPEHARSGAVLIVDLRRARQQARGRIPGSHALPPARLISGEAPEGDLVLVAANRDQATRVAEALRQSGYDRQLRHLDGGFPAWERAGLPVVRSQHGERSLAEVACGGVLMLLATVTQSLGMLALGLVLVCGPWLQARARA